MKIFLAYFVAMGSIVSLVAIRCFTELRNPEWPYKGCIWNGKIYPLGYIERTEGCYTCDCDKYAMRCCSNLINPPDYNGEKCKVIFNRKRCNYDVVQKDDPSKVCYSFSRVG